MRIRKLLPVLLAVLLLLSATGAFAFDGSLSSGDVSTDVWILQNRLDALGYSVGTLDGAYGGMTSGAVSSFQTERGLDATGVVDQATWDALFDERCAVVNGDHEIEVGLVPPYVTLLPGDREYLADMELLGSTCRYILGTENEDFYEVFLTCFDTQQTWFDAYYDQSGTDTDPTVLPEELEVNGHRAGLMSSQYPGLVDGEAVDVYAYTGILELVEGEAPAVALACLYFAGKGEEPLVTADTIISALGTVTVPGTAGTTGGFGGLSSAHDVLGAQQEDDAAAEEPAEESAEEQIGGFKGIVSPLQQDTQP